MFCATTMWALLSVFSPGQPLAAATTYDIAVEDDAAPWSLADGSGFANDVVRESFKAAGAEVRFKVVPYERCKKMVMSGEVCACFSMSWLDEFSGLVQFPEKPLFSCKAGYFVRAQDPKAARGRPAKRSVVGVVRGYEYPPAVYALKQDGSIRFEEGESERQNLKRLAAGKIDAAIVNYNEMKSPESILASAGVKARIRRLFDCGILESHIGFSLKHPQGRKALEDFNLGRSAIASDSRLNAIRKKWSTDRIEKAP